MEEYIISIKQIDWLDKDNPEAEILFELNGQQFWAFCHPCSFKEGEMAKVYFNFIEEDTAESAFWNENSDHKIGMLSSENNRCHYYCYGQLKSTHPVIINCGVINLSFGDWINDERMKGSYVYFVISRLDITKIQDLDYLRK